MDQLAAEARAWTRPSCAGANFIAPDDFPHKTVAGATYDSGEYARALDRVLEAAGYDALRAEQAQRRERGDVQAARDRPVHLRRAHRPRRRGRHLHGRTRTAPSPSRPARRRRARATRRRGRSSCRGRSACRWTTCSVVHSDTAQGPARHGHDGLALAAGRRQRDDQRHPRGAGQGPASSRPTCSRPPSTTSQVVPGQGLGVAGTPSATISWAELAKAAADPAALPEGMEPGLRRDQRLRDARTRATRSAPTSPSSRSTPRPA